MIIEKELVQLNRYLESSFTDPLPDQELKAFVTGSSKRIRSRIALLYFRALGYDITEKFYKILVVGELVHNASLLHDDVLDNAEYRRNVETLSKKISSGISILAGDYLLSIAIKELMSLRNFEIIEVFRDCTEKMVEAEINQFTLRGSLPSEEEYFEICNGKTAALFGSIMKACAIVMGEDANQANVFGEKYGFCFQIKNDLNADSAIADKNNEIYTAIDILGIEKTKRLLDNYKEEMNMLLGSMPDNIYKKSLEELIKSL